MRLVIQRAQSAQVVVDNKVVGKIGKGLLVLLGIAADDTEDDVDWLVHKLLHLRIFDDEGGVMNYSVQDVQGDLLIISQFTLLAATKKGHRPSYIRAAKHETAIPLYESFLAKAETLLGQTVQCGVFGAHMEVSLVNDGPVTLHIDSRARE
jgi:D-tyrosyl-tRNA(Tyr) deacylase